MKPYLDILITGQEIVFSATGWVAWILAIYLVLLTVKVILDIILRILKWKLKKKK